MTDSRQIHTIEARQQEIADEISRLQQESDELAIAMRVLQRFANQPPPKTKSDAEIDELWVPRPNGTPTNFDMVDSVLASAEKEGKDGLTGSEIVKEIGRRFWPGLVGAQILPPIYQFAKKGRLRKTPNGKFKRVRE